MTDHRHATDRTEWTIHAACPESDGHLAVALDARSATISRDEILDELQAVTGEECPECGAELGFVTQEEPTEVLG